MREIIDGDHAVAQGIAGTDALELGVGEPACCMDGFGHIAYVGARISRRDLAGFFELAHAGVERLRIQDSRKGSFQHPYGLVETVGM